MLLANFTLDSINNYSICKAVFIATAVHFVLQLFTLYPAILLCTVSTAIHYIVYVRIYSYSLCINLQLFTLFLQLLTSYLDLFTIVYKAIHSVAFPFVSTLRFNIYPLCIYCCSAISTCFHNVSTVLMFFCNYSFSLCFLGCSLCIYIDSLCIYMDSPCIYSCLL